MTKYRTRILPQLLTGQAKNGKLAPRLTFALAALMAFYRGERNEQNYPVQDDVEWMERYRALWSAHRDAQLSTRELVKAVLSVEAHWQQDLSQVPGLEDQVTLDLDAILLRGMREAVKPLC
ncbi:Altronate oxidoreductase [Raoultella terrigena]|uniref:Altronate oxidoreductase n=2 Tax=Raoultella terrigena TaxID=577 RepID=A0A3P8M2C0_RAOTE|nr:Altronate oxidoreductase [Raoultella terrigena]